MRKKYIALLLLFCFFSCVFPVLASATSTCLENGQDCEVVNQEVLDNIEKAQDEAGILNGFFIGQVKDVFSIGGINSIANLVFGNPYLVWMDEDVNQQIYYNLFYESELNLFIRPLMMMFAASYVSFVALAIMISTIKFNLKSYSPQARADLWTDVQMWVMSAFFMGTFSLLVEVLFGFNEAITQTVKNLMEDRMGVDVFGVSIIAFAANNDQSFFENIGNLLVLLAEWVLAAYLNVIYIARKIIIIFLIILSAVAAISLLYARTRAFFGVWLKELAGNIFLQSIHAIVLAVFAGMASLGAGMIMKLGMLIMFIPITGMISKWLNLGDSSTAVGRAATMAGVAGLGGAIMLARGAKSVVESRRDQSSYRSSGNRTGSSPANDAATTDLTAAAAGSHSSGWQRTKALAAGVGGVAGSVAGLPLGGTGVAIGGYLGSKAGKGLTQLGRNVAGGLGGAFRTVTDPLKSQADGTWKSVLAPKNWASGYAKMWGDLAERRKFFGNMGEALGNVVGLGQAGRSVGHMLSGASRNRVMSEQFGNQTLEDWAKKYPGAPIQWRQDNQGSAFYAKMGGHWKQISPYGAANSSLKKGEILKIDYKLNNGTTWTRQENGTFVAEMGKTSYGPGAGGRQVVGLSGSTPQLARVSGVYMEGADGKKFEDNRVNPKDINPDEYFSHNVVGAPNRRSFSDKGADVLSGINRNFHSWRAGMAKENTNRNKGII